MGQTQQLAELKKQEKEIAAQIRASGQKLNMAPAETGKVVYVVTVLTFVPKRASQTNW